MTEQFEPESRSVSMRFEVETGVLLRGSQEAKGHERPWGEVESGPQLRSEAAHRDSAREAF